MTIAIPATPTLEKKTVCDGRKGGPASSSKKQLPPLPGDGNDADDDSGAGAPMARVKSNNIVLPNKSSGQQRHIGGPKGRPLRPDTPAELLAVAERRHQLGDVLFRRAQAKLLLEHQSDTVLLDALKDAQLVCRNFP